MNMLVNLLGAPGRPLFDWRAARVVLTLMLSGLLAGCWMSETPLLGTEQASTVAFAGPYKPEKDESAIVQVTANPDGSYSLFDQKGEGFTAFFMEVQDGWYVAQQDFKEVARQSQVEQVEGGEVEMKVPEGEGPYLYTLMHLEGNDLAVYLPDCDEATQAAPDVALDAESKQFVEVCTFASLTALKQAAPGYIARIEAGDIKEGPSFLRSIAGASD